MQRILAGIEAILERLPLPLLEVWGGLAYITGFALAIFAFAGFTFRIGSGWGLAREIHAWDARALLSVPLTFLLIVLNGYAGSFFVLVPGAQTFESLKDLFVFLGILLFGYPALITVPFAYGLSDLIEGVPPEFLLDWLPGYFINPTCFWIAYQIFGKNPDFRRLSTWGAYFFFVIVFLLLEPLMWGHICSGKFTTEISYRNITPALFFTTSVTWTIAPFAMLLALPLARRARLFWAEIPGHVKERALSGPRTWEAGGGSAPLLAEEGIPIRIFFLAPFITFVLFMVGTTAFVTLKAAESEATRMAERLHILIAENIRLRLKDIPVEAGNEGLNELLAEHESLQEGRTWILAPDFTTLASSRTGDDPVFSSAIWALKLQGGHSRLVEGLFRFDHLSARPLARETWLARSARANHPSGKSLILLTAMPEAFYLAGVRAGTSRSATVFAVALLLALLITAGLAAFVTRPVERMARATSAVARGELAPSAPRSYLKELDVLARSFNQMAEQLKESFEELWEEAEQRKQTESALRDSELRYRKLSESLEREIAARTADLERALIKAESADRLKSAFLATMSHELRTPLNSILGFTGILLMGMPGPLNPEQERQLQMVQNSARHLLELINDVLDISRIEAGELRIHRGDFDLRSALERLARSVLPLAEGRQLYLKWELDALASWHSDQRRVEQIILNLLHNAIKFTESGGVTMVLRRSTNGIAVRIEDTGIGIRTEDFSALFVPFQQIDSVLSRSREGTGLGLAISQRLARILGGEITVESTPGEGSTFTLFLPELRQAPV